MDFYVIKEKSTKRGIREIFPDFRVGRSKDLMVRGQRFYAIWDEEAGLWSTDEYDVQRLVDQDLYAYKKHLQRNTEDEVVVKTLSDFSSGMWEAFKKYVKSMSDNSHQLDEKLTFANDEVKKKDYVSKRLSYPLEKGECKAYDELIGTLYEPEERAKLEWAIGAVVAGEGKRIQKFIVLYGEAGAGKSTILNIIQRLFDGYYTTFEAKALTSTSNAFATEVFKSNPLVAIQHDGDLSHIEDNTKLNSIVSHEEMTMNEKYKASYTARVNCFLFMATNRPVKITDAKSGVIRRLIDVKPSGQRIPAKKYQALMNQIQFELGAIASHCLEVYREMGKNYYDGYVPFDMIFQTDVFFNFVEDSYDIFKAQDGVSLRQAYAMYKTYCEDTLVQFKLPMYKFREEMKNYFRTFEEEARVDGKHIRSYFSGFKTEKFFSRKPEVEEHQSWLNLDCSESLLDQEYAECKAQYASSKETPLKKWEQVTTKLKDLDTSKLHYVIPPNEQHIMIDFDLKDEKGEKSLARNLEAASQWPPTYAECSKGGQGLHLHYICDLDVNDLSRIFQEGIEVKVFNGGSSIRRRVSKCNNIPIAHVNSGLPLKGVKKVINFDAVQSEKGLRNLIERNLKKEIHPATKPSIDFIYKILEDAYQSGLHYDVTDLRPKILAFAVNSSHQSEYCVKLVNQMKFRSEDASKPEVEDEEAPIVFFDVEIFPNLFLVNWKYQGEENGCVRMINPSPQEIEKLLRFRLIGFNCRRYDNHILYARYIGYSNQELFELSQRIIGESRNCMFGEAYNLSYTDVYDFSSKKQSLKKFEIELGLHHQELGLPWDQPVPEELWPKVAEYCDNDVISTEATFNARQADWVARLILSELSGLCPNETTQHQAAKIIFGDDPHPQDKFVYTDLSEMFPGYTFENGKSTYRGEEVGEGGYVWAEPGMYSNVPVDDIASMHPTSIEQLNLFGPYTQNFSDIKSARIAIKHEDRKALETILDGRLLPFYDAAILPFGPYTSNFNNISDPKYTLDDLAYAMKIVINIVYGLTSAKFPNKFKDPRNVDNIVAKRGALFMIDLKHAVQDQGFTVAHIKTDSIKIPNATPEILQFVEDFGKKYGYTFEHEATYDRMCLVNDAVYIAKYDDQGIRNKGGKHANEWTATGTQFQVPYVFKTLFSKEPIEFKDMCETKTVSAGLMYLDFNEDLPEEEHKYQFVGKAGSFCPMKPGCGGGLLLREKDGKYYAVTGTKGYRWMEAEVVQELHKEDDIDQSYYIALVDAAVETISKYGDFEIFQNGEFMNSPEFICLHQDLGSCADCPDNKTCKISGEAEVPWD